MVDLIIGAALAAMVFRGWLRGMVREVLDLAGLVVGIWIAFRLSAPMATFLVEGFGVSPEFARIGGGILLFVLFGATMSVAAHYLSKIMNLPGLTLINRVGGALVAVAWGVLLAFVVLSLVKLLPIPDGFKQEVEASRAAEQIIGPDAIPAQVFTRVAGDNVMAAVAAIEDLFGAPRAVPEGGESLSIPAATPDEIRQSRDDADFVVDKINEYRLSKDLRVLATVGPLTDLAETLASDMYVSGALARLNDCRLTLAGIGYQVASCDSAVALAGTARAAFDGILDSPDGAVALSARDTDRVGVSVVDGPTGRLVVIVVSS